MITALLFGVLLLLLLLGVPVAFAILATSLCYLLLAPGVKPFIAIQQFSGGLESFPLLAVPLFILAGVIMSHSGIAERIVGFANTLVGHTRGGLAQVNVLNSVVMGGMSGSANADAAMDSRVLVPQMVKHGYGRDFSGAVSAASSLLAVLIPPSIVLILYGLQANVSIGDLFMGGLLPAAVMAISMSLTVFFVAKRRGYQPTALRRPTASVVFRSTGRAFWALMMPVLLLVGLRIGVFTPTELSAVAVVYTLVIGMLIYRTVRVRDLGPLLSEATKTTGMVLLIIGAASAFGYVIRAERVPQVIAEAMLSITEDKWMLLIIINVMLLVLGMLIEPASLIILATPILAPLAVEIGVDPVHFGIIVALNLAIGGITPPVGTILFTVMSITGSRLGALVRELGPFYLCLIVALAIVVAVPALSTLLPSLT
ncbi:TRAP transporter large permease [Ruicaihuangia caeni]|uniref:TRAP transporter large permease n=1 Tax=Ruicaihuangia caeni TaxID=3042517 RepID=A0AAW6T481_9MICO|nr:TRAP transporter large permease [Klugiella sp. YN-L-19]MDI2098497.1 TRAP transporter large permease [Klugiella sp. YN-L-19]